MARTSHKIGLLHHCGGGNLGDDATQAAVLDNIKRRWPDAVICGFTMNPSDTQTRHGIRSYAIRRHTWDLGAKTVNGQATFKSKVKTGLTRYRAVYTVLKAINAVAIRAPRSFLQELLFLAKSWRLIRSFDLLIINGGGQLLDSWGGPWSFPYTLFKWVCIARLSHVRCYFLNVGAGPINHPLSKWLLKRALGLADYISFRDADSQLLVRQIGFTGPTVVCADSVYSLPVSRPRPNRSAGCGRPTVGLSPMAYADPRVYYEKDQGVYDSLIDHLAVFGTWLNRQHYELTLFSTDICFDSQCIKDLKAALENSGDDRDPRLLTEEPITTLNDLLSTTARMDYVITFRFHGVIFAHLLNIPVLAIAHHPKVAALMNDLGLGDYCLDIDTVNSDALIRTFTRLVNNSDDLKARMAEQVAGYRRTLFTQFDGLFTQDRAVYQQRPVSDVKSHA